MLKWLRRSTRSWFIYLAIGAIVVVFIFWGVGSYKASRSQDAAEVNGVVIPMTEFSRQYNELVKKYQERTGGEVTPEMIKSLRLKEMALSQLVEEALLLQAAPRLGLEVTNAELRHHIQSYPFFQQDGKFDEKRYFGLLSRHRLSPQGFEAQERQQLLLRKVVEEVTSFAKVSDAELQEFFRMAKEEVDVNYLAVSPEKFLARENPADDAVARYYQENEAEFRLPDRARVNYLIFRPKDYLNRVKLTPTAVADYLKEHQDEYTRPLVIRAQQILLTLPPKASHPRGRRPAGDRKVEVHRIHVKVVAQIDPILVHLPGHRGHRGGVHFLGRGLLQSLAVPGCGRSQRRRHPYYRIQSTIQRVGKEIPGTGRRRGDAGDDQGPAAQGDGPEPAR